MTKRKMILDLDTGVDDALALAVALKQKDAELIAVISSYGNTLAKTAAQNSLNLLHLLGADDIPVYLGQQHSTNTNNFQTMAISKQIHGENGIGDIVLESSPRKIEEQSGVNFLIEAAETFQENLIYVPTGPLTNLAVAFNQNSSAIQKIGNVTLMGGALTVPGNVTPFAEANINQDPFSANLVFANQPRLTMVGLDVTLRTLLTKKDTATWRQLGTNKAIQYADMMDFYINAYDRLNIDHRGAALHDPLAVFVALDPSYVTLLPLNMQVTTDQKNNDYARTIGDKNKLLTPTTTKTAVLVDHGRFVDDFQATMLDILA